MFLEAVIMVSEHPRMFLATAMAIYMYNLAEQQPLTLHQAHAPSTQAASH